MSALEEQIDEKIDELRFLYGDWFDKNLRGICDPGKVGNYVVISISALILDILINGDNALTEKTVDSFLALVKEALTDVIKINYLGELDRDKVQ